jgi:hypothetical protein
MALRRLGRSLAVSVWASLCAAPGLAQAAAAARDLNCAATDSFPVVPRLTGRMAPKFVVKPSTAELCFRQQCEPLTAGEAGRLEYRCTRTKGGDDCLGTDPFNSAGPFVNEETLVIDVAKGVFGGSVKGTVGDMGPEFFTIEVMGLCRPAGR